MLPKQSSSFVSAYWQPPQELQGEKSNSCTRARRRPLTFPRTSARSAPERSSAQASAEAPSMEKTMLSSPASTRVF